jgi:hypothetical protein
MSQETAEFTMVVDLAPRNASSDAGELGNPGMT